VQLQTKSQAGSENMSEPGATSDKIPGPKRKYVRTLVNFGQNHRSKAKICPNPDQLQTKSQAGSENMSEPGATSDKISGQKRKYVRTLINFGQITGQKRKYVRTRCNFSQNDELKVKICPNLVQLRTNFQAGSGNFILIHGLFKRSKQ
jgi:hypothetical protein